MNLTDNEIIKAFEDAVICVGQAPFVEKVAKGEQLKSDIIDLINRQKAEVEDLKHSEEVLYRVKEDLKLQIKELQNEVKIKTDVYKEIKAERDKEHQYAMHYVRMCAKAKSEAIKEFWNKLKNTSQYHEIDNEFYIIECDGDNLVKEFLNEDTNEKV